MFESKKSESVFVIQFCNYLSLCVLLWVVPTVFWN